MNKRIIGLDVARALAIIGMILVNFKTALGEEGESILKSITNLLEGKAAATFVVLAGIGIALMTKKAIQKKEILKKIRLRIIKKALFLFLIGSCCMLIWPADILHYYTFYILITVSLLRMSNKQLFIIAIFIILSYPIFFLFFDYEIGWNFKTLDYYGIWTAKGFLRNLFLNGFHPIFPWTAFMLLGYWFGRQNLESNTFLYKIFKLSSISFILCQAFSSFLIIFLSEGNVETAAELEYAIGTSPMPPFPLYMLNGISIAFASISACILLAKNYENSFIVKSLKQTGQLALTLYFAHIVLGMGTIALIFPEKIGTFSLHFSLSYGLLFSFLSILFANKWKKRNTKGPLERLIQSFTK